jgi:hypothetical protein
MRVLLILSYLAACGDRRAPAPFDASVPVAPVPPAPRWKPLDDAHLAALAQVSVPDFAPGAVDRTATSVVVMSKAPPLRALVTIGPCLHCLPADAAAWKDITPELRQMMPAALEDDPSTQFELSAITLGGNPCIATWELGAVAYGSELVADHGARVYCNDGATELVVRVDDDAVAAAATVDAARSAAHRDVIEAAARTIASAYLAAL